MTEGPSITTTLADGSQLHVVANDNGSATFAVAVADGDSWQGVVVDPLTAAQIGDMLVSRAVGLGRPVPIGLLDDVCARAVAGSAPPYAPDRFGLMPDRPTSPDDERTSPWLDALRHHGPGTMQAQPGQPVHAARALEHVQIGGAAHPIAMPLCDVDARGVVTSDRTLVDCDLCLALIADAQTPPCPNRCNDGYVERVATPAEVDAGFELGVAFDPCPSCNPQPDAVAGVVDGPPCITDSEVAEAFDVPVEMIERTDAFERGVEIT